MSCASTEMCAGTEETERGSPPWRIPELLFREGDGGHTRNLGSLGVSTAAGSNLGPCFHQSIIPNPLPGAQT
jgi:hypothetical protein